MARRIALTGIPGSGKTTVATALAAHHADVRVVHLNAFAAAEKLLGEPDPVRGSLIVDMDALADAFEARFADEMRPILVEGHFAHEMDVDNIVLLRVDPMVLHARLSARGWPEAKVRENVEAEALDVLAGELLEIDVPAWELDATSLSVEDITARLYEIADGRPEGLKGDAVGTAAWPLEALPWF